MTEEQLRRIKERADNASVGWVAVEDIFVVTLDDAGKCVVVAECDNEANANFIGEARQDVPKLLAEVERLQVELVNKHFMSENLRGEIARLTNTIEIMRKLVNKDDQD